MELITILLSGLLGALSPTGLILDSVAENAIRARFESVEQLQVRVDNAPSYQLLQGKVERVRIAGRGLSPRPGLRIAALELETDPLEFEPSSLRQGNPILEQPVQAGVRLVLEPEDINQLLRSPAVAERLQNIGLSLLGTSPDQAARRYEAVNPRVEFLEGDRLRFQVELQEQGTTDQLPIQVETGLAIVLGRRLQLVEPVVEVNGNPIPAFIVQGVAEGVSQRFDLRNFEDAGVTARLLKLDIESNQLEIAGFVRLEPSIIRSRN